MGWTAYPGIEAVLNRLLAGCREILGDDLFGMYLFGSLASGGFDPDTSDIDFVVVTRSAVGAETETALGHLNREIQAKGAPWAGLLEGSFLPLAAFADPPPAEALYPTIGMGGRFGRDHKGIERALLRHLLREDGIALAGPTPASFIAPVSAEALRQETRDLLSDWWAPQLDDPTRLRRRGYQAYAVLTMCRALHTLETGGMASKPQAAHWARQRLPDRWHGLIDRAGAWKADDGVDDLAATLDLIRHVITTLPATSQSLP
jgi:Predicted nucleotidyltransferases